MSGTIEGGKKAAKTNKERFGENFYSEIGRKGGLNGHTGGFAANKELAHKVGAKGGRNSARGPRLVKVNGKTYEFRTLRDSVDFMEDLGAKGKKFVNGKVEMTMPSGEKVHIIRKPGYF